MKTTSLKIWIRVIDFISYDNICYTMGAPNPLPPLSLSLFLSLSFPLSDSLSLSPSLFFSL